MSTSDQQARTYDVKLVVVSRWHGNVPADTATKAEEAAREAFDEGQLQQYEEEIVHADVRPAAKKFSVTYAVEQGFTVVIDAATADDAEAAVEKRLSDDHIVLGHSERGHFDATVIGVEEVKP